MLAGAFAGAPSGGGAFAAGRDAEFADAVSRAFSASGVPGAAVAVATSGRIVTVNVMGRRRLGRPEPIEPDDAFHLASLTKPMTATMIALLVSEGVLSWDSTPAAVWPSEAARMNVATREITLRRLLDHRSGLAAYTDIAQIRAVPRFAGDESVERRAFVIWLLHRRPPFRGGDFHYSNAGYAVAAAMAEAAAGQPWRRLMATRVFGPLGLGSCGFGWPASRDPAAPSGHWYSGDHFTPQSLGQGYAIAGFLAPAEDVSCDVRDTARFGQAWLLAFKNAGPLASLDLSGFASAPSGGYVRGWMVGAGALYHLGGAGTFHGALLINPADDLVVAVLANAGQSRSGVSLVNRTLTAGLNAYGGGRPPGGSTAVEDSPNTPRLSSVPAADLAKHD